jgi:hypothetical protein
MGVIFGYWRRSPIGRKLTISAKRKAAPKDGFGNDFGNKADGLPKTLVIPVDLAEAVRFELTEDFHPRQFSRLVHSTALPSFHLLRPQL